MLPEEPVKNVLEALEWMARRSAKLSFYGPVVVVVSRPPMAGIVEIRVRDLRSWAFDSAEHTSRAPIEGTVADALLRVVREAQEILGRE